MTKYVDGEDYLKLLSEKVVSSAYLAQATIYVDGFHHYTPQINGISRADESL